jgi:hypothetical protein
MLEFNASYFFRPDASKVEKALALRSLLDNLIELNTVYLRYHSAPSLYASGVVYKRDPIWNPIPTYEAGIGDCKSLACALIAEYRQHGIPANPAFRFLPPFYQGTALEYTLFHILVQTPSGFEDPSKRLGMLDSDLKPFYSQSTIDYRLSTIGYRPSAVGLQGLEDY